MVTAAGDVHGIGDAGDVHCGWMARGGSIFASSVAGSDDREVLRWVLFGTSM